MKKHILIIWSIFVFILLAMPMPENATAVVDSISYADKLVHFLMFGIFSYLIIFTYRNRYKNNGLYLISALLGIIYSALGEFIQSFIPSRTVSNYDFYAGVLGVMFFVIYYYIKNEKA